MLGTAAAARSRSAFGVDFIGFRSQTDRAVFDAAWAEGHTLASEQAMEYALALSDLVAPVVPPPTGALDQIAIRAHRAGLTARKTEVLRLLAQDLAYAQIAEALVVSRRTVNAHLTAIYSKLGVTSRAAAGRLASEHGLV